MAYLVPDIRERRLWLREAIRPWRGTEGANLNLRGPFRPAHGHGETYVWLCRPFAGGLSWPASLCLAEIAPSGALAPRGQMRALDFLTIYGIADFLRALAGAFDPRAAAPALGTVAASEGIARTA